MGQNTVQALLTDNGATMAAAVHKAVWAHYPSLHVILNLVVKDSLRLFLIYSSSIQLRCNAFFHQSTRAAEKHKNI